MRIGLVIAAAALAGSIAPPGAANLVKNGSFEKPVVGDDTYQLFNTGDSFMGWVVVGDPGNVAIIGPDFSYCAALAAKKGKQFLDLTGTSDTATGVQTSITTSPGSTYALAFFVGNLVGSGNCGTTTTVNVYVDGTSVGSFTNRKGKDGSFVWKKFSTQFTAQNTTTTIAFINGDPSGDTGSGLDAISVTLVTAR